MLTFIRSRLFNLSALSSKLHQQNIHLYNAYDVETNQSIYKLLINSCGITDIVRVLYLSKITVTSKIIKMAMQVNKSVFYENFQSYEMDELCTKVHGKQCWVSYAINRKTKEVISLVVGSKSNDNLIKVVSTLLNLNPKTIYTDKLKYYYGLILKSIHNNARFQTNHIERLNLYLRTHLKRLNQKTLCHSKSLLMLEAS